MLIDVALPLSLAIIMFSLGLGLSVADFARVAAMPRAVLTGIIAQVVALPVIAFVLLMLFPLPPAMAFGVMILSFCPGGVTSNILTRLGGGNVALSIKLTAIVSLLSVLTVPVLVAWAAGHFLGAQAPGIEVTSIAIAMFAITAVPVLLGLGFRAALTKLAERIERAVSTVATVLFVVIVVAALVTNWTLFVENNLVLGPLLVVLNLILLLVGALVARALSLGGTDAVAIAVELGVQNAALGIAVAGLVAQASGISEYAVPAAVYGITMYFVSIPGMFLLRQVHLTA